MGKVSVIIPARNEKYLKQTVTDVKGNAYGDIEIIVYMDGDYDGGEELKDMGGVRVVGGEHPLGLKNALNTLVDEATGDYIFKLDAHCSVSSGFDMILQHECPENWIMVPSHYNLDMAAWEKTKGPVNCYYMAFPYDLGNNRGGGLYPRIWKKRNDSTRSLIESMNMVGCCWFMHKKKWYEIGGMDLKDSTTLSPESQELPLKVWLSNGKVVFNTAVWYAHYWQRTTRGYDIEQKTQHKPAELFLIDYFMNNRWSKQEISIEDFIDYFSPIPGWPEDWKAAKSEYEKKYPEMFPVELDPSWCRGTPSESPEIPEQQEKTWTYSPDNPGMVSIVIPARNEPYLSQTVESVFDNARGPIEVFVTLDGYWPVPGLKSHKNLHIIHNGTPQGMRENANAVARIMNGEYIMKIDAHCMFGKGFDVVLKENCEKDWLCVPSRYSLDAENWKRGRGPTDYLYLTYPGGDDNMYGKGLHGKKWIGANMGSKEFYRKERENADIQIDDIMTFQGSCWFMHLGKFLEIGNLDAENYGFFQEAQEIGMKVWMSENGRVVRNKKTWYAHWHKSDKRGYPLSKKQKHRTEEFSVDYWMNDKWPHIQKGRGIEWFIDKFWPVPGWPEDWKERRRDGF